MLRRQKYALSQSTTPLACTLSMPNMIGRPGCWTVEMIGGSSLSYLARTPRVPLFSSLLNRSGNRRAFRPPGESGDHFHCTVEPSPGHIWCREVPSETNRKKSSGRSCVRGRKKSININFLVRISRGHS